MQYGLDRPRTSRALFRYLQACISRFVDISHTVPTVTWLSEKKYEIWENKNKKRVFYVLLLSVGFEDDEHVTPS